MALLEAPVPMFSGRMTRETDVYYRLEVFTQTGSGGYDLLGLTRQQVIDDVLDRYEAQLAFLTLSSQTHTASVLTPTAPPAGPWCPQRRAPRCRPRLASAGAANAVMQPAQGAALAGGAKKSAFAGRRSSSRSTFITTAMPVLPAGTPA